MKTESNWCKGLTPGGLHLLTGKELRLAATVSMAWIWPHFPARF